MGFFVWVTSLTCPRALELIVCIIYDHKTIMTENPAGTRFSMTDRWCDYTQAWQLRVNITLFSVSYTLHVNGLTQNNYAHWMKKLRICKVDNVKWSKAWKIAMLCDAWVMRVSKQNINCVYKGYKLMTQRWVFGILSPSTLFNKVICD